MACAEHQEQRQGQRAALAALRPLIVNGTVPPQIESLFVRHSALSGFAVRSALEVPDNCTRSRDETEAAESLRRRTFARALR